jgi:hypothetical protein
MIAPSFPSSSKVMIYASARVLDQTEQIWLAEQCDVFTAKWNTHGKAMQATSIILYDRFLCIIVNDSITAPSGCSIDSNVRFVKQIGMELNIDFFNRLNIWTSQNDQLEKVHFTSLPALPDHTFIFETQVENLGKLRNAWPVEKSKSLLLT